MNKSGMVIVLSGFSGAGKGTIMKHLLSDYPEKYHLSVSATTRGKRQGEEDGREYFFKTREQFEDMIRNHELLEYASFNQNYYGTPKAYVDQLLSEGKDVILEIEVQGALQIKKIFPQALLLFVTPPDGATLKERLEGRGTEEAEVVLQRLAIASRESLLMEQYDYIIVNDDLDRAVHSVHHLIQAEHERAIRNTDFINKIQNELSVFSKGENE
ncbi:MAG TPA: guanylate kinase [Lachnospiraceae bacterium]|jgi:guanylate kinase|nr:guanylate kinase [Lachnospiraceae bacterium]HBE08429.1 guanylate kinase [Lachnospiraceae bacterium]